MNPAMTGRTFAHYRVAGKIGEGGMGVVYEGEDTRLRRRVALKFLSGSLTGDPKAKARFLREAEAAAALDHPNICPVYGMEEEDGFLCLIMALVDGPSLSQRMNGGMTLAEVLDSAVEICEGLRCAHDHGVIHRDIKASNILTTRQGVARITDFGLAFLENRSRLTERGTLLGTINVMAPEQVMAEDADCRTDIWALGVLFYEMLSGRQPFHRANHEKTMHAILHECPQELTSLPSPLRRDFAWIVDKTLSKARSERYQHVDDLVTDLRSIRRRLTPDQAASPVGTRLLSELPTSIVTVRQRAAAPRSRMEWWMIAGASVILALLVLILVQMIR